MSGARRAPFVFGIGLSRTGTTSLARALNLLGRRAVHYPDPALMVAGRFEEALGGFDAATDITVAAVFEALDRAFPGSKFVLTTREESAWIDSVERHYRRRVTVDTPGCPKAAVRERVYSARMFDRDAILSAGRRHEARVRAFFARRPADLLVLPVEHADPWGALSGFLGAQRPDAAYPHLNARAA